jgi:CPA2 family monovalent cation:H+ antiporter-2
MHSLDLILTLTAGLTVALLFGYITQRLGLSPIVGYLLAGIAVSPTTPGFVADQSIAEQLAEVGVILLMFGVGLQFHLKELLAVRKVAVPGAVVQCLVATLLGVLVTHLFGWSWSAGLIFGLAISVASTVVLLRVLSDNRDLHTPTGHIAVGWLVVEDLFTVLVLVLLPAIFGGGESAGPLWLTLIVAVVKVSVLIAVVFVVGGRVVPWLLHRVALTQSRELFTLTVLVVALGIAVASAKVFGVSMALGAFLAGMVVGRSDFSLRAASEALPMRDAFAVLFFVSVGMLLDPRSLLDMPGLILTTLAIILIGKPLAAWLIVVALGYPIKTALGVSVALAQIGEFSFILATVGTDLGLLPPAGTQALVAAAIISISINPLIYRTTDSMAAWMLKSKKLRKLLKRRRGVKPEEVREEEEGPSPYRAVIIGYGPIGRTLVRLLRENEVEPSIIDLNFEAVQAAKRQGIPAVYGDATQPDALHEAATHLAGTLILSSSNLHGSAEVIRLARQMNPKIRVLARVGYVAELKAIKQAGADVIFSGEGEVALALTTAVLRELGASAEQIDRERDRVRLELVEIQAPDVDTAARAG